MIKQILQQNNGFWSSKGPFNEIIFSSRIRLARNMSEIPFINELDEYHIESLKTAIDHFIKNSCYNKNLYLIDLNKISSNEKRFLRERNIITYEMEISSNSFVIINEVDDFSIMVNEEDHFRIQVIKSGLQLNEAYRIADKVDDELNKFIPYSFSNEYGYLTGCPSNLGTGIKASVIVHLPILTKLNKISNIIMDLTEIGAELTGLNTSGIKSTGSLYQVSNKISLGISEIDTIELLDGSISRIIEKEDNARDKYLSENRLELENSIWRSFGILLYARHINYSEAMEHLSNIKVGIILAIIKKIDLYYINNLMVNIQQSHLQNYYKEVFIDKTECNEYRAEFLRKNIQGAE